MTEKKQYSFAERMAAEEKYEINKRLYRGFNPQFFAKMMARQRAERIARSKKPKAARTDLLLARKAEIDAYHLSQGRTAGQQRGVRKPMLRELLLTAPRAPEGLEPKAIIAWAEDHWGLVRGEINGPGRTMMVIAARYHAIMEVVRVRPTWSTPQLGKLFGRDHSTILNVKSVAGDLWPIQNLTERNQWTGPAQSPASTGSSGSATAWDSTIVKTPYGSGTW